MQRRHRVLLVSDFFFPNTGGMEHHVYKLAQNLIALGHKACTAFADGLLLLSLMVNIVHVLLLCRRWL